MSFGFEGLISAVTHCRWKKKKKSCLCGGHGIRCLSSISEKATLYMDGLHSLAVRWKTVSMKCASRTSHNSTNYEAFNGIYVFSVILKLRFLFFSSNCPSVFHIQNERPSYPQEKNIVWQHTTVEGTVAVVLPRLCKV
jgi:hypothetical protein